MTTQDDLEPQAQPVQPAGPSQQPEAPRPSRRPSPSRRALSRAARELIAEADDSAAGRLMGEWRRGLVEDAGGAAQVTTAREMLFDAIVVQRLVLAALDAALLGKRGGIVNRRSAEVSRLVRDRQAAAEVLARLLDRIGLDRVARPTRSLAAIMAADALAAQQEAAQRAARGAVEGEAAPVVADAPEGQQ